METQELTEKQKANEKKASLALEWLKKNAAKIKKVGDQHVAIKEFTATGPDRDGAYDVDASGIIVVGVRQLAAWFARAKKIEAISAADFDQAMLLSWPKDEDQSKE